MEKIRMGVSACLMGEKVRYDGQHKHDTYITETLGQWFEFVPVCAEFELGLGVPRETMRLEGDPEHPRLMTGKSRRDLTASMREWCDKRVGELEQENLCGFIFKSKSPSCGMERVKVYSEHGMPSNTGRGLFADAFMNRFPLLPVEEEGRLHDPALRENFIECVFALRRWRELLAENNTRAGLVKFHERHKYLLMSHSVPAYRALGRIVAEMKGRRLPVVQKEYLGQMMEALRARATVSRHVNVLEHLAGYFKKPLGPDEKAELRETIASYKAGHVPLIVPITLINHYIRKYQEPYLADQYYLKPNPVELRLRNHVY
ncbi:YbgA family protein [Pontiella sp.]|uniref:YbgA family protein n=2 Tax=Pontiella sp. TaxID=2837462 RepID=UPI00356A85A2